MKRIRDIAIFAAALVAIAAGSIAHGQEYYYSGDSAYQVVRSDTRIAIQFDSTLVQGASGALFDRHPCLNISFTPEYLDRGFSIYGLNPGCGYAASAASLLSDPAVHRALPVYRTPGDSADLPVTDLVSVRFEPELPTDSALALLAAYGLRFVDSSEFRHNLWQCALNDTITESPLGYGNALHFAPGVLWACAALAVRPVLAGPTDPYYQYQYYLKNTGQDSGVANMDINVEPAWQVPLMHPTPRVAVIDDGVTAHTELSWPRLRPGYDFVGWKAAAFQPDSDASPGPRRAHGMAATGILAAAHNGTGIAGVCGTCEVVPVKIFDDAGNGSSRTKVIVDAIYYAQLSGARVVSNSWTSLQTLPVQEVADAIRDVTGSCPQPPPSSYSGVSQLKNPEFLSGLVMVFAAGNGADNCGDGPAAVHFPANMPEVIAVGAIKNTGARWDYSCYGSALDVVAPSGDDGDTCGDRSWASDQWSIDQMADSGWNPYVTGATDAKGDRDYTSRMGGTSGACPQVAGIAALLLAHGGFYIDACNPGPKIREIITSTATDMGTAGWDQYYGYGLANAYRALLSVCNCPFQGDINADGGIDVFDVIDASGIAFSGGSDIQDPSCPTTRGDVNNDLVTDVFDVIQIIAIAFSSGFVCNPCTPGVPPGCP